MWERGKAGYRVEEVEADTSAKGKVLVAGARGEGVWEGGKAECREEEMNAGTSVRGKVLMAGARIERGGRLGAK